MKQPIFSESHEKIVKLLQENGRTNFTGGIQLFANQFDTEWSISINFNGTGLHISKKDIDPVELEGDELIQVCKSWMWRG